MAVRTASEYCPWATSLNNDEHIPPRGKPLPQVAEAGKLARKAIYAEDSNRPYTPEKLGKRPAHNAFDTFELPYAQFDYDNFEGVVPQCPLPSNERKVQPVSGKVGAGGFVPQHYADQMALTKQNGELMKYKFSHGAGNIVAHD